MTNMDILACNASEGCTFHGHEGSLWFTCAYMHVGVEPQQQDEFNQWKEIDLVKLMF